MGFGDKVPMISAAYAARPGHLILGKTSKKKGKNPLPYFTPVALKIRIAGFEPARLRFKVACLTSLAISDE